MDRTFVAEDLPANGSTDIRLECTESTHRVVLEVVSSDGKTAAVAHEVRTVPGGGGGEKPTIDSFTVKADGCTGETANVSATYATTGAETVEFEVDGEAPGAQAGLPTSGTENVPDVPCEVATHQITLVATNASDRSVCRRPIRSTPRPPDGLFATSSLAHLPAAGRRHPPSPALRERGASG